jgi:hypothetical protein
MCTTGQAHLAKYVLERQSKNDDVKQYRPLRNDELQYMHINRSDLVKALNTDTLLNFSNFTESVGFSQMHIDHINRQQSQNDKNQVLLSLLERRSFGQFLQVIRILKETDQHTIAFLLTEDARVLQMIHNPQVIHVIHNEGNPVRGVATVGSELFVVRYESRVIQVYSTSDFAELRQIKVSDMEHPNSLAACQHHNCLYISDYVLEHIHRVDLSNSSVTKWRVVDWPGGLSVTTNHHLLVTACIHRFSPSRDAIYEYTTRGSLMREISLDVSIDGPLHSIELSSGQFVVCHDGRTQHRVCTVDTSGRIIHSYGGPKGSSAEQLYGPSCLAVDEHGCVLVADGNNHKVQILSPALTHLGDVTLPQHKLHRPHRLHLDELNGRLYIGEDSGRVLVLTLH